MWIDLVSAERLKVELATGLADIVEATVTFLMMIIAAE